MPENRRDIVAIGASAGGVQALQQLVAGLPADFPAAVFVVLHLWPGAQSYLSEILGRAGPLPATEARDGMAIEQGRIHVAPSDYHLFVEREKMLVVRGPRENRARPAINPLFRSAATAYGPRVIGVVLTGMLDDGAAGLWAIKQGRGIAVVQSDAAFAQMPRTAVENVAVDHYVPLEQIPPLLDRLSRESIATVDPAVVPPVIQFSVEGAQLKSKGFDLDRFGKRTVFSCPECNGALWELEEGTLQFRCHVGHGYSPDSLKLAQSASIEQSLWSAIRALKESAALDERLAERSAEHRLEKAAEQHRQNANAKLKQVEQLQQFLASRGARTSA
jgi:two-component system, chemotaxis family, protein-glutamate methylesterase/glutaminase